METIVRKEWGSPLGKFQVFTPQEFVAACIPVSKLDGSYHFDIYSLGSYGYYDGLNNERISGAFGPVALQDHGGETFTVDVYRWCRVLKPSDIWTAEEAAARYSSDHHHLWSTSGPNGGGETWEWYDQWNTRQGRWNSATGHFVQVATGVTLKMSASGNVATIYGEIPGISSSGGSNVAS